MIDNHPVPAKNQYSAYINIKTIMFLETNLTVEEGIREINGNGKNTININF